jgi:hypothetical protein
LIVNHTTFETEIKKWCTEWFSTQHSVFVKERGYERWLLSRSHIGVFLPTCVIAASLRGLCHIDGPWKESAVILYGRLQEHLLESRTLLRQTMECP